MPTEPRDQRRAQRIENARRWGQWLTQAMAQGRIEPKDIVNGSGNTINKGDVSHWMNGDSGISAENAIIVARILRRSPIDALRAAGHNTIAEAMTPPSEAEQRARIADLEAQIEARLARLGTIQANGGHEENGDLGAS